jgi:membrane protease YdiL (CAAX protease family)
MGRLSETLHDGTSVQVELNGSWENKGRNITAAALTGLAGIGAIFVYAQTFLGIILIVIWGVVQKPAISGNFVEKLNFLTNEFKVPLLIALVVSEFGFMLLPVLWVIKKWHTSDVLKYIRVRRCSLQEIILAVLITVSFIPVCSFVSYFIMQLLHVPEIYKDTGPQLFTAYSGTELAVLFFVVAVTPAICEEVLFRGYFQRTLERTIGVKSFIVTGIVFGLFHMQPLSLIALSMLGLLFSFFYYRSQSILPSGIAHFTNNSIAILSLYFSTKHAGGLKVNLETFSAGWVILSLLIGTGLMFIYIKITTDKKNNNDSIVPDEYNNKTELI